MAAHEFVYSSSFTIYCLSPRVALAWGDTGGSTHPPRAGFLTLSPPLATAGAGCWSLGGRKDGGGEAFPQQYRAQAMGGDLAGGRDGPRLPDPASLGRGSSDPVWRMPRAPPSDGIRVVPISSGGSSPGAARTTPAATGEATFPGGRIRLSWGRWS